MLQKHEHDSLKKNIKNFNLLPDNTINLLLKNATIRTMQAGNFLESEGQICLTLDILLEGTKRIYKLDESGRTFNLFTLSPYEICPLNILCILTNEPFPALAQSISKLRYVSIPSKDILAACSTCPELMQIVLKKAYSDTTSLIVLLAEIVCRGVRDRLEELLQKKSVHGVVMGSHQSLADELCTSREVVSKLLKQMEHEGVLSLSRMRIQMCDAEDALQPSSDRTPCSS